MAVWHDRGITLQPVGACTAPTKSFIIHPWGSKTQTPNGSERSIMATFIANAFSLSMVEAADLPRVRFESCARPERTIANGRFVSAVGHADTAALLGVPCNRVSVKLAQFGDWLYIAQYKGPRLPEGTTTLPEGASFDWVICRLAE